MINNQTIQNDARKLYLQAANGDGSAFEFLVLFDQYFELLRAFIAKPGSTRELVGLFAKTNLVYSLPFYARNGSTLRLTIESALASIPGPNGDLGLGDVVLAVASLTGGFAHSQSLSFTVKELLLASREPKV